VQAKRHRAYGSFGLARLRRALSSRVPLAQVGVVSSGVSVSRAKPDHDLQQTGLTHAYDPLLRSALKTGLLFRTRTCFTPTPALDSCPADKVSYPTDRKRRYLTKPPGAFTDTRARAACFVVVWGAAVQGLASVRSRSGRALGCIALRTGPARESA